jgi:outer membrane protein TolC
MHRATSCAGIAAAISGIVLLSNLAAAQAPAPPPKAPPGAKAPAGAKAPPAAPTPPPPATPPAQPAAIILNDPMLVPVPPAPRMLTGWKEALTYITSRSLDVAGAYQEIERAEGQRRQALALALPSITATGNITGQIVTGQLTVLGVSQAVPQTNPAVTGTLTAQMQVLGPRAWYGIRTAELNIASKKLTYDDKRRTALAAVANSIVTVMTAERVADINRVGLRSSLEKLDLTRRKFRLGDATQLDVLRAEQDAATTRSSLISGDESLLQAREALGLSLGFTDPFGVPSTISLGDIEQSIGGVCTAGKLDDRADIRQQKNDIEVASRGITDAWLAFSPTATLSTTASVANAQQSQSGHIGAWSISGVLTIPLWEGGARYGGIRIARANAEEAKLALEATMRGATQSVAQALRGVTVAEQSRAVAAVTRDLAKESARLAQRAYEVGTGTSFDLVTTAQQERAAELDLAVKEFRVISARLTAVLAAANCTY